MELGSPVSCLFTTLDDEMGHADTIPALKEHGPQ